MTTMGGDADMGASDSDSDDGTPFPTDGRPNRIVLKLVVGDGRPRLVGHAPVPGS